MTVDPALTRRLIDDLQTAALTAQRLVLMTRLQSVDAAAFLHAIKRAVADMQRMLPPPPPEQKDGGR